MGGIYAHIDTWPVIACQMGRKLIVALAIDVDGGWDANYSVLPSSRPPVTG